MMRPREGKDFKRLKVTLIHYQRARTGTAKPTAPVSPGGAQHALDSQRAHFEEEGGAQEVSRDAAVRVLA
jgi:hypothetical protein